MSAQKLLDELRSAIQKFVDLDDDAVIEPWDRQLVLKLSSPETAWWSKQTLSGKMPETYLLMVRRGRDPVAEMVWRPKAGLAIDRCPIVGLSEGGDATVLAGSLEDWLDSVLYTGGAAGGGAEEDLETAREEASREAVRLGDDVADEMDRDLPDLEALGERWEAAQDAWFDEWADAAEGLD